MIQIDMEMPNACSECEFATEPCGICAAKEMENSSKGIKSEDICTVPYCNHRKPSEIGYGKPDWCPLKEVKLIERKPRKTAKAEFVGAGSFWWYMCVECGSLILKGDKYCNGCGRRLIWK